jgi:hypothetical protein
MYTCWKYKNQTVGDMFRVELVYPATNRASRMRKQMEGGRRIVFFLVCLHALFLRFRSCFFVCLFLLFLFRVINNV